MDERLDTLRSEQLDFLAQAHENYNNLSSQLGELVAYINRGNDKKGEGSSSRRPQPPPDDQNRPSGDNASRGGGGGGSEVAEEMMERALQRKGNLEVVVQVDHIKRALNGGYTGRISFRLSFFQFLYKFSVQSSVNEI
ncbi:hypothetical protein F511_44143 [Dorcoceras hygrometricum]|uniref:Uncharacterized protein n=1 Tax=Dorcoceras hygrometricum TaxID=472368 RepID=A0A2Z7CQP7_9LAMI|nr:hypothetical protein F511_44143 [Dorcoceras hygrometricum]